MFIDFVYRLRDLGVPVGAGDALTLAQAMSAGLHDDSLNGFYHTARSVLVHHEGHLDAFDQAFIAEFGDADGVLPQLSEELRSWLDEAAQAAAERDSQDAPTELPDTAAIDELLREFAERMKEQTERHDGGNYWIGTGGTSKFGQAGKSQQGLSTGSSGGGRSALHVADARNYRPYRSDVTLDIRQFEVALKRLRSFVREGAESELDIERTIDATAENAGDIEIVVRPPRKPDTHLILMIDVGGSMYPYSELMSTLFSATKKATHFKDLRTFYFHNLIYGKVYESDRFTEPVWVHDLMRQCGSHYKLVVVGDAYMAPYELFHSSQLSERNQSAVTGLEWLDILTRHYRQSVWLNPEPESRWKGNTIADVARIFDMYPMTVEGLTDAMARLNRGTTSVR